MRHSNLLRVYRTLSTLAPLIAVAHTSIRNTEHIVRLPCASWSPLAALKFPASLKIGHHVENGVQALVADDH